MLSFPFPLTGKSTFDNTCYFIIDCMVDKSDIDRPILKTIVTFDSALYDENKSKSVSDFDPENMPDGIHYVEFDLMLDFTLALRVPSVYPSHPFKAIDDVLGYRDAILKGGEKDEKDLLFLCPISDK